MASLVARPEEAIFDVPAACQRAGRDVATLPFSIRVLLENVLRHVGEAEGPPTREDVACLIAFERNRGRGVPVQVSRVVLPDSSGVPVLLDLAALRDTVRDRGGRAEAVDAAVPVDLVVDHSLQVDFAGAPGAIDLNVRREFERNGERYRFLKWAEQAFGSLRVHPPGTGIIHQLNLESLAQVVMTSARGGRDIAHPEFIIGGDSHTTMVNGLGVLGWGVGGIEAEAAILGLPYDASIPEIVGVRLMGSLRPGVTVTDAVLTLTERLRREGVVGAIVEYFGDGADKLDVPDRATIANMAPEYGATAGLFPIDAGTVSYLARTRSVEHAGFVERYARGNALFRTPDTAVPSYSRIVNFELGEVSPSVAGPRRPQDRLDLGDVARDFRARLGRPLAEGGFPAGNGENHSAALPHGAIALAAITSCTNTSNPAAMVAAGLLARNAVAAGLSIPSWVKTSFAPGSRVVPRYLAELGLLDPLEALGFHVVGYGCTTCGGKSGPLHQQVADAVEQHGTVVAAVLSGNRNFEGRIHRLVRANYIMSPALVVAYAIAGRVDFDIQAEPLGFDRDGRPVTLGSLWPKDSDIEAGLALAAQPALFAAVYGEGRPPAYWATLAAPTGPHFTWDRDSTYLLKPPFFELQHSEASNPDRIEGARVLAAFGDSLTTDHISPSGEIPKDSAAGRYLLDLGVEPLRFNTYVGRRGNHEVMARATFANLRIRNLLAGGREGGWTRLWPEGDIVPIHEAAAVYRERRVPAIVLGGREYGTGSSRDWAAKGPALLGVRAVLASSFERIHRSNLIGMGILPLQLPDGASWTDLGLTGEEVLTVEGILDALARGSALGVSATAGSRRVAFEVRLAITTESERRLLAEGGIAAAVLNRFGGRAASAAA